MAQTTTGSADSSDYHRIARTGWQAFFDAVESSVRGQRVEVEVVGLDIGDQIEAEWLPLDGLTYDPGDDTFYVAFDQPEPTEHAVEHPREILVHTAPSGGVDQVIAVDDEGRRHIIRLRQPIALPAPSP